MFQALESGYLLKKSGKSVTICSHQSGILIQAEPKVSQQIKLKIIYDFSVDALLL